MEAVYLAMTAMCEPEQAHVTSGSRARAVRSSETGWRAFGPHVLGSQGSLIGVIG